MRDMPNSRAIARLLVEKGLDAWPSALLSNGLADEASAVWVVEP